ncbi:MAG TPA: hypothetical protein VEH27_12890 [Methylomirabilota bacterium]|nr:hypothetical protein [Methylomirabilota bacterium]
MKRATHLPLFIFREIPVVWRTLLLLLLAVQPLRSQVVITNADPAEVLSAIRAGGHIRLGFVGSVGFSNAIPISTDVTIEGLDRASNILSGSSVTRLFVVEPTGILRLRNVSLVSGRVTPTTITNGIIQSYAGAGIYNDRGTVEAYNSSFSTHSVVGPAAQAGADNATFDGQNGEDAIDVYGAAIYNNSGSIFLSNCIVHRNDLSAGNGGKGGNGGNFGNGRNGGRGGRGGSAYGSGLYSLGGSVTLSGVYFATNTAIGATGGQGGTGGGVLGRHGSTGETGHGGGAVSQSGGALMVEGSVFEGNRAVGGNGATGLAGQQSFEGQNGQSGGTGVGAGIYALTDLTIQNSIFVRNSSVGGVGGAGGAGGPTSFGSDGGDGGVGGPAFGGGVLVGGGFRATILNSTFHDNILTPGLGGAGGAGSGFTGRRGSDGPLGEAAGAALYSPGLSDVANSIFAFSRGGGNLAGNINDLGGNLSTDRSYDLHGPNSAYPIDPRLLPLRFITSRFAPIMGLRADSPALGRALPQYAPALDIRGLPRGAGAASGAYQLPAQPVLRISRIASTNTNVVRLIVPITSPETRVESTTNIVNPFAWTLRTNVVQQTGTSLVLDVPATNRMEFFRVIVP